MGSVEVLEALYVSEMKGLGPEMPKSSGRRVFRWEHVLPLESLMTDNDGQMIPLLAKAEILKFSTSLWQFPSGSLSLLRGSIIIRCSENCKVSIGEINHDLLEFPSSSNCLEIFQGLLAWGGGRGSFLGHCSGCRAAYSWDRGKQQKDLKASWVSPDGRIHSSR